MQTLIIRLAYRLILRTAKKHWPFFLFLLLFVSSIYALVFQQIAFAKKIIFSRPAEMVREDIELFWPVQSTSITSMYGYREDPFTGEKDFHSGMDITATRGTAIFAAHDGRVILSEPKTGYGETIMIRYEGKSVKDKEIVTLYGHLSGYVVKEGDKVKQGDLIGLVGSTGRSTGPHLHFGVLVEGEYVDPFPFLILDFGIYVELQKNMYGELDYVVEINDDGTEEKEEVSVRSLVLDTEFPQVVPTHMVESWIKDETDDTISFSLKGYALFNKEPPLEKVDENRVDGVYIRTKLSGYLEEGIIEINKKDAFENLKLLGGMLE